MNPTRHFPVFSFRKRKPGPRELAGLLNLHPKAALIIDTTQNLIQQANERACELCAYSGEDISGLALNKLLPELAHCPSEAEAEISTPLLRRNGSMFICRVAVQSLSVDGWCLLTFEAEQEVQRAQRSARHYSRLSEHQRSLITALLEADLPASLASILEVGRALTGAEELGLYRARGSSLDLQRIAYLGHGLLNELPSQDLIAHKTPGLWTPGKRPRSSLQRLARTQEYKYLASAPLGQENAAIGLLVIASLSEEPSKELSATLTLLASAASASLQHFALVENLRASLEERRRINRYYEVIAATIPDSLVILTAELNILSLNRAAEVSLGYHQDEARNLPVDHVLIGTDTLLAELKLAQRGIPTLGQENIRLYRRTGESFLARVSTLPVEVEEQVIGIAILIQDLSEQEHIQAQARQLEQRALLGEVTAVFAHEVRNPINNISTGLQLMAYNLPNDDPNQALIGRLQQDCDRLAEQMKAVLQFARPADYEMESVDPGMLILRLVERLKPRLTRANVQHNLQIAANTPSVWGNGRALEQVFNNLITNAVQAMEKGGNLSIKIQSIRSDSQRPQVEFSIADDGPGIAKEHLERLFQPFFTTKSDGTGLGLAITKRIVTAHKGTIQVRSIPGATIFSVLLPAHLTNHEAR